MVWNFVSSKMGFICKETKFVRKLKIKRYRWLATRLQLQLCYSLRFVVPEIFLRVVEVSSNILYSVIPRTTIREQCYIVASSTNLSTRSRPKIRRRSCTEAVIRPWKIYLYLSFLLCSRNSYPNHYSISIDRVSKESSRLKFRSLEKFRRISNTNSSNLRILLRINWSIDEDSSAFVASTMKWLFFFERRPRINERKKRERKEKKRFRSRVHRSSFPRRLHQAAQGYPILERRLQRGRFHAERAILVHGRDSLLLHAALALGSGIEVHVSSSKNFNVRFTNRAQSTLL